MPDPAQIPLGGVASIDELVAWMADLEAAIRTIKQEKASADQRVLELTLQLSDQTAKLQDLEAELQTMRLRYLRARRG